MRRRTRMKKLHLNKVTVRQLTGADEDGGWSWIVGTCGCWTDKDRSVCCKSQEPCHADGA